MASGSLIGLGPSLQYPLIERSAQHLTMRERQVCAAHKYEISIALPGSSVQSAAGPSPESAPASMRRALVIERRVLLAGSSVTRLFVLTIQILGFDHLVGDRQSPKARSRESACVVPVAGPREVAVRPCDSSYRADDETRPENALVGHGRAQSGALPSCAIARYSVFGW